MQSNKERLFEAMRRGDREEAIQLMEAHNFGPNVRSALFGGTPILAYAILNGDHQFAQNLVDRGADVHAVVDGMPLIHMARDARSVEMLVAAGADVNASLQKEYAILSKGTTPLHKAALNDNTEVLEALIRAGATVDAVDQRGFTPLHFAASRSLTASKALVLAGADPDADSKNGLTPTSLLQRTFGFAESALPWLRERATALATSAIERFRSGAPGETSVQKQAPRPRF